MERLRMNQGQAAGLLSFIVPVATPVARDESTTVIVMAVSVSTHRLLGLVVLRVMIPVALSTVAVNLDKSELNTWTGPADAPKTVSNTFSLLVSEIVTAPGDSLMPGVAAFTVTE